MYCSKCGKEIPEEDKFCKYCGTKIVGKDVEAEEKETRQVRETIPSYDTPKMIPRDMLNKGDKIVFETHPDKKYLFSNRWVAAFVFATIGMGIIYITIKLNVFPVAFIGIPMVIYAWRVVVFPAQKWRNTIYGLTTNRVITLKGGADKNLREIPLGKIQDIGLRISSRQRGFGCGDIIITTAGTAGVECVWENISNPQGVMRILRVLLEAAKKEGEQ